MNIGVAQWCLKEGNVKSIFKAHQMMCNVLHLDSDMQPGQWRLDNPKVREEYLDASQKYGIQLVAIGVNSLCDYGMKNSLSTNIGQTALQETMIAIEAAAAMKIPIVTLPSFFQGQIHTTQDIENTLEFLNLTVNVAKNYGVDLALENSLGPMEQLYLCQTINSPNVKILFDTYNPLVFGYDPIEIWHQLRDYICPVIHIKDGQNGTMGNVLLGNGDAPIQQLLPLIRNSYPDVHLIIETEYALMQDNTTQLFNKDLRTLQSFWETS